MAGPQKPGPDKVLMGRIGAAHGISGEVRVQSFAADPLDIAAYGPLETDRPGLVIEITKARRQKNMVIARVKGVSERNGAERLNGVSLYIARDRLPDADADEFYHTDLIGLEARDSAGAVLGHVVAVPDFGAGDLLEIKPAQGQSFYVPFTLAVVPEVKVREGYVTIVLPDEVVVRDLPEDEA